MMISERPAAGPLRLRCLQLIGADANITEIRTLTLLPDKEKIVYQELSAYLRKSSGLWDWVRWTGVHAGEVAPALLEKDGWRWVGEVTDWVLPLRPTWEEFRSGLSRNVKESLRKCVNAPRRDGVEFTLEVATLPAQMERSLDRFFELHARRAELSEAVPHPNVFRTRSSQQFLRELCGRFAARGVVHVFNLKKGDATIATRIGFRLGDSMYLYFSGYDPAWGKYSAMTSCLAGAIRWSIEAGLKTVNLSTGTDVSKTRWSPRLHLFREVRSVSPGLHAHAGHAGYAWTMNHLGAERVRTFFARLARRRV